MKSEARNPKYETNPNDGNSNDRNAPVLNFEHSDLDIVSNFDIRISDFLKQGFTLLEMTISIGIFSVLVIAAIGIILGVSRAQSKAANLQAVLDNVRFSMELITRELRTGTNYQIVSGRCPDQIGAGLQFVSRNRISGPQDRMYYHADADNDGGVDTIMRAAPGDTSGIDCGQARALTSEEVIVDQFRIELAGAEVGPQDGQPRASLSMHARARDPKLGTDTAMNLHTAITQRLRDTE